MARQLPGTGSTIASVGWHTVGTAVGFASAYWSWGARVKAGENPASAGIQEAIGAAAFATMGFLPAMAVTSGFSLAKSASVGSYNYYQHYQQFRRQATTPFSHKFEHTDATLNAQQRGMQAIGAGRGFLGSEAGMMAQRYARR